MSGRCSKCGRMPTPLVPCCSGEPTAPPRRAAVPTPQPTDAELPDDASFKGFEIVRPDGSGLAISGDVRTAAGCMLMFSGDAIPVEHLPLIVLQYTRTNGAKLTVPATPYDLERIRTAAESSSIRERFPKRLERLIEAGRLPRSA